MAAIFDAPLASVLLAVELLLFEWRPRSFIPVPRRSPWRRASACPLLGGGAVFPAPHRRSGTSRRLYGCSCIVAGALAGAARRLIATTLVYASEDAFARLPDPLDVVAGDRRPGHRRRRPDRAPRRSASATT